MKVLYHTFFLRGRILTFVVQVVWFNMYIEKLSLINFKNYAEADITLHPRLNCFVGNNGQGKTNLLDAVYYLCMCKSYFNNSDIYSIRNNEEFMTLQSVFRRDGKYHANSANKV